MCLNRLSTLAGIVHTLVDIEKQLYGTASVFWAFCKCFSAIIFTSCFNCEVAVLSKKSGTASHQMSHKKATILKFHNKIKILSLNWNREGKYVLKTKIKSFCALSIWKTFVIFFWFLELASFFSSDSVCLLPLRNNWGEKLSLFFPLWVVLKLMEVTLTHIREEMHEKEYFCKLSWIFNLA